MTLVPPRLSELNTFPTLATLRPIMAPESSPGSLRLHYGSPALDWDQALPLGNGRLGCMVHGRTDTELLQLNEDSVWHGGPQERTPRDALAHLPQLRHLIRHGQHREAEDLVNNAFFSTPTSMRHYEPLGSCYLELAPHKADVTDYKRDLDLETARHTVTYRCGSVFHQRQTIASFPDNVLATLVTSSEPIRMTIRLNRVCEADPGTNEFLDSNRAQGARIVIHATPGGRDSNRLCIVLGVCCKDENGTVEAVGNCLVVNSSSCVIAIGAHTTYRHADPEVAAHKNVNAALSLRWEELLHRHQTDYKALFQRTQLQMYPDAPHIHTDERVSKHRDAGLAALYHHYGRYLLIASSRNAPKALPSTLQGIWNQSFTPAWGSKYTININLQMNGWPAAPCDLMECVMPVVELLETMAVRGTVTAKTMYGCRGWCAHHNTDMWGDTDPQDRWMPSTLWPLGGLWLCVDVVGMLHFRYDQALHERLYPLLEGCVEFLLDFLVVSRDGRHLVTNPSLSPENTFVSSDGTLGIFCEGSTMDTTIVRLGFEEYLWSHRVLDRPPNEYVDKIKVALGQSERAGPKLQDIIVNDSGLIQEWGATDYAEHEPGHRHVSHLFGLYPASYINQMETPNLCEAARRVLGRRAEHGGGHTGWSRAWLLNLHARLGDAEGCERHMSQLLSASTLPNMLDNHPPFQIDGNFGGCAGVLECLVQSALVTSWDKIEVSQTLITLLPSCPGSWESGRLGGVNVRGGWKVSFSWERGRIIDPVRIEATQKTPLPFTILFPAARTQRVSDCESRAYEVGAEYIRPMVETVQ